MRIPFTKMQGAGNDFVVLDETRQCYGLGAAHYRFLAHRRFGVGADQILSVRPAPSADVDFAYVIHNADGSEVEHCGNGARCFVRFVRERRLTSKDVIRVQVQRGVITLHAQADGLVTVDMGAPVFDAAALPFDAAALPPSCQPRTQGSATLWPLPVARSNGQPLEATLVSMGNPHAVLRVDDTATAPVAAVGAAVQALAAFPRSVNVGLMQVLNRHHIRLRVYERGAGETLACGTGACAAVVAGVAQGVLSSPVRVDALGGTLHICWDGAQHPVRMTGPATTVFTGEIDVPEHPLAHLPDKL